MDRIILNIDQINKLLAWRDKHKELVRQYKTIINNGEIYVEDTKKQMFFKVDGDYIDFNVPRGFKAKIEILDELQGYRVVSADIEDHAMITDTLALYFAVTAFIYYFKPEIKTRQYSHRQSQFRDNKRKSVRVITVKGVIYHLPENIKVGRKPPKRYMEAWGVRGHERHLADGRVVHVKPYQKGKGKVQSKNYKVKL